MASYPKTKKQHRTCEDVVRSWNQLDRFQHWTFTKLNHHRTCCEAACRWYTVDPSNEGTGCHRLRLLLHLRQGEGVDVVDSGQGSFMGRCVEDTIRIHRWFWNKGWGSWAEGIVTSRFSARGWIWIQAVKVVDRQLMLFATSHGTWRNNLMAVILWKKIYHVFWQRLFFGVPTPPKLRKNFNKKTLNIWISLHLIHKLVIHWEDLGWC